MIGRGGHQDPDFIARLDTAGGGVKVPGGLMPENYWAPGPSGRRSPAQIARIPVRSIEFLVYRLEAMLRNVVGLNVRQPSHEVPPFRSVQWTFQTQVPDSGAAVSTAVTFFGSTTQVPEGVRGVAAFMVFQRIAQAIGSGGTPTFPPFVGIWDGTGPTATVLKNGSAIPGLQAIEPGYGIWGQTLSGADTDMAGSQVQNPMILVPIKLEAGDTLTFTHTGITAGVGARDLFMLQGWFYPIEVEADGVLGTLADRGSGPRVSGGV